MSGWRDLFGRPRGVSWLLVGLGNPGPEYARTRHNLGFLVLDELARRAGLARARRKRRYSGRILQAGDRLLLWPQTYMNLSGRSVGPALHALGLGPERLVVVHDDLDLSLGKIKVKRGGGSAGHKGVASVIEALGTGDFCRIRCGIGRPGPGEDVVDYVLGPFAEEEREAVEQMVLSAADAVEVVTEDGVEAAMNRFNRT